MNKIFLLLIKGCKKKFGEKNALAGNRTRAARVAGEHSTTEPPVLLNIYSSRIEAK